MGGFRLVPDVRLATYTLNLVSLKETQAIDEDPRKRAAKVEQLVDDEGHDAGGQDIVLHPRIPCDPQSLCHAQVGIGFGNIPILAPIGAGGQLGRIPRRKKVSMRHSTTEHNSTTRGVQKAEETDIVVSSRSQFSNKREKADAERRRSLCCGKGSKQRIWVRELCAI